MIITKLFMCALILTIFCTTVVGIAWLFDCKPNNLYLLWEVCGEVTTVLLLLQILFGVKITFK